MKNDQEIMVTIGGIECKPHCFKTFVADIQPEEALCLLDLNYGNRSVRRAVVKDLVRDITFGRWKFNGDAIRFGADGRLLDGQHRLLACVEAEMPIKTMVVTGLPLDTNSTIDRGSRRTIGDHFTFQGVKNANATAATIRELYKICSVEYGAPRLTTDEASVILGVHPGLQTACRRIVQSVVTNGFIAALYYVLLADGHDEKAEQWASVWTSGERAYVGCPAHAVREMFIRQKMKGYSYSSVAEREFLTTAFHHFRHGRQVKTPKRFADSARLAVPGWDVRRLGLSR